MIISDLTIPNEALPLLRGAYARCYEEEFARFVAAHARGGLVAVRQGSSFVLVPSEVWARVSADVAGIVREIAAAAR